jgi:hypothetical protein
VVANISIEEPELKVSSGRSRLGFVGVPLAFESKIKSAKHIPTGGSAGNIWSMGDGSIESGQFISHTYEFPGDYIVVLNSDWGGAHAVSRSQIRIIEPKIAVAYAEAGYIEIKNLDGHELNLGGWILETGTGRYIIPQDTIIAAFSTIAISKNISNLNGFLKYVSIKNPSGQTLVKKELSPNISYGEHETLVMLPEGYTEEVLRHRLISALGNRQNVPALNTKENLVNKENSPIHNNIEVPITDAYTLMATSTKSENNMSASVIYTVSDNKESSIWDSLKKVLGR